MDWRSPLSMHTHNTEELIHCHVSQTNNHMKWIWAASYLVIILVMLVACRDGSGDSAVTMTQDGPPALDPQRVARGEEVYALHCASCHGVDLQGEVDWKMQNADGSFRSPPHDESGHTWHHSDTQLMAAVRLGGARLPADIGGTSAMPAYDDILSDEEMGAVLDYIKSHWPVEIRQFQWEVTRQTNP